MLKHLQITKLVLLYVSAVKPISFPRMQISLLLLHPLLMKPANNVKSAEELNEVSINGAKAADLINDKLAAIVKNWCS